MSSGDAALEGHTSTLKKTPETHFHEHPVNNSVKIQNALPESGTTREHSVRPPTPEKLEQIKRNGPEEAGRLQGGSISFSESPTGILKTSVDLVDAAAKLIAFLKCVHGWQGNRHGQLYMPGALFSAAEKRYRTVWLPLLAACRADDAPPLAPPIDVAWVWYLHRLHPTSYRRDCQKAFGFVVPQASEGCLYTAEEEREADVEARTQWARHAHESEPFDLAFEGFTAERIGAKATPPGGVEITCDLARSARRQGEFLWQLIDPMCQKQHVLVRAAERYTVLLGQVWYRHQDLPTVEPMLDLMWHAHVAFPAAYATDTLQAPTTQLDEDSCMPMARLFELRVCSVVDDLYPQAHQQSILGTSDLAHPQFADGLSLHGSMPSWREPPPAWYWEDPQLVVAGTAGPVCEGVSLPPLNVKPIELTPMGGTTNHQPVTDGHSDAPAGRAEQARFPSNVSGFNPSGQHAAAPATFIGSKVPKPKFPGTVMNSSIPMRNMSSVEGGNHTNPLEGMSSSMVSGPGLSAVVDGGSTGQRVQNPLAGNDKMVNLPDKELEERRKARAKRAAVARERVWFQRALACFVIAIMGFVIWGAWTAEVIQQHVENQDHVTPIIATLSFLSLIIGVLIIAVRNRKGRYFRDLLNGREQRRTKYREQGNHQDSEDEDETNSIPMGNQTEQLEDFEGGFSSYEYSANIH
mmetsp:Transcript_37744/g.70843  ORF Transcript_37744/g.70843 Transcript_37744/m.70843 type:complete len:691 (-) Transcript_37744:191-2263(-)